MPRELIQQKQLRPFINGHNIYRAEESTGAPRIESARSEELGAPNELGVYVDEISSDVTLRFREQGSLYPYLALFKDLTYDLEEADLPDTLTTLDMITGFAHCIFPVIKKEEIGVEVPEIWRNYVMDKAGITSIGWTFNVDGPSVINVSMTASSYKIFKNSAILIERHAAVTAGAVTTAKTPTKVVRVIAEAPAAIANEDITDVCAIGTGNITVGTFNDETPTMVTVVYAYTQAEGDPGLFYGRLLSETVVAGVDSLEVTYVPLAVISVRDDTGALITGSWTAGGAGGKIVSGGTVTQSKDYVVTYITAKEPTGLLNEVTKGEVKLYLAESYASKGTRLTGVSAASANWGLNREDREELGNIDPYLTIANLPADITVDLTLDETEDIDSFLEKIIDVDEEDPLIDFQNVNNSKNLYVEILDSSGNVVLVYKFPDLMLTSSSSGVALGGTANRPVSFSSDDVVITTDPGQAGF